MNPEVMRAIIIEGQELIEEIKAIKRNVAFEEEARYVFVGARQSGKSYLLYLRALDLIAAGHSLQEMVYINFDDERLIGFKASDLDLILQAYASLFESKPILFLDEIQNVEGWEHFARRMANMKYRVYITGSNAKMLSRDIATILGGRYIEEYVFPYSFKEYMSARGLDPDKDYKYGKNRGEAVRLLEDYFQWGGFPELLLFTNKRRWLNELYEKIILGDIITRNGIRNEMALRLTVARMAMNLRQPTSFNRLANMVKSTGVSTNVASVSDYVRYCREACLMFELENFGSKFSERESVKKHYFIDNGLLAIFLTHGETSLLENLVVLTLYRRWKAGQAERPWFYNKEVELDVYLAEARHGLQVSYSMVDPATEEREVRALEVFNNQYGLNKAEIVTWSEDREIVRGGLRIRVVSLLNWLLENS